LAVAAKRPRPSDIMAVAGILLLDGIIDTAVGGLILGVASNSDPALKLEGAAVAALGLFAILVSGELWTGKAWAREGGLAIAVLGFVGDAFQLVTSGFNSPQLVNVLVGTLLNVGIIVGLTTSETKAYLGIGPTPARMSE